MIRRAFERDFEVNGPSLLRMFQVTLLGLQRYKDHAEKRVRDRYRREAKSLKYTYAAATWAMRHWFRGDAGIFGKADTLLRDIYSEHGWKTRMVSPLLGSAIYVAMKMEAKRLAAGWTYEPVSFYERNPRAMELEQSQEAGSHLPACKCKWAAGELPVAE